MQRYLMAIGMLALVLPAPPAAAAEAQAARETAVATDVGTAREWLRMQRDGEQASVIDRTLPGPVQDRVYQRYLDSFDYPIPENFYSRDRFREVQ